MTPHISPPSAAAPSARGWDVIVVGTGIAGALMAEALTRRPRRVLVVDRSDPVRGTTFAAGAMIRSMHDRPLTQLAGQIGAGPAAAAWRRSVMAVGALVRLTERLGIACGLRARQALTLGGAGTGDSALADEAAARVAAGVTADYLDRAALLGRFGIDRGGAILSPAAAAANPVQLAAGLLRAAVARGAEIVSPLAVTDVAELRGGVALATGDGRILTAGHVVFCAGHDLLPGMAGAGQRITSAWALASAPGVACPGWLDGTILCDAAAPGLSCALTADGRIIATGGEVPSPSAWQDPAALRASGDSLLARLAELTGARVKPAHLWAAPYGATADGLPLIDRVPGLDRVWRATGLGGNGITAAMIAAQVIGAALAGKSDPDAGLFALR